MLSSVATSVKTDEQNYSRFLSDLFQPPRSFPSSLLPPRSMCKPLAQTMLSTLLAPKSVLDEALPLPEAVPNARDGLPRSTSFRAVSRTNMEEASMTMKPVFKGVSKTRSSAHDLSLKWKIKGYSKEFKDEGEGERQRGRNELQPFNVLKLGAA